MTRKLTRNYFPSLVAFFIAILTLLIAAAVLAQTSGADRQSVKPADASAQLPSALQGLPMRFAKAVPYASGAYWPFSVGVADLNGDGHPDLVVANICQPTEAGDCLGSMMDFGAISVLSGNGNGTFQPAVIYRTGGYDSFSVAIGDVNGDGRPDLVATNYWPNFFGGSNGTVGVLLNGGGWGFSQPPATFDSGGQDPMAVAIGDVNGDGKPDIVVANDVSVGVLLGNGDGTFQQAITYDPGGSGPRSVVVADVNGDGKPDIVVANYYSDLVAVFLGTGDGTFQAALTYSTGGSSPQSVAVADVNGDHKPDLVVANYHSNSIGVRLGNGDGTFQPAVTYGSGAFPNSIAVADVNGDGPPDLVVANCEDFCGGSGVVSVLLGNGDGTFRPPVSYGSGGVGAISVAIGDVNGDGKPDLLVGNNGSNSVAVLLNASGFATTAHVTSSLDPSLIGQSVTFTATVTSKHGAIPDGELVTFYDGKTAIGTGTTASGVATFVTSSLTAKTHTIKATYAGDVMFAASTGMVTQVVNKYPTTTALGSSPNPSAYRQTVTFTATVTATGPYPLTGKVWFKDGTLGIGTATLSGGVATFTRRWLAVGTHPITAQYLGDSANAKSTSAVLNQVVQ